jgi:hypothetical protein
VVVDFELFLILVKVAPVLDDDQAKQYMHDHIHNRYNQ